jgi:hypothetical protein
METKRLTEFQNLKTHPWHGRLFKKLLVAEVTACEQFIKNNDHLEVNEFEMAVQRMFLDKSAKPKNWTAMNELLVCANTAAYGTGYTTRE